LRLVVGRSREQRSVVGVFQYCVTRYLIVWLLGGSSVSVLCCSQSANVPALEKLDNPFICGEGQTRRDLKCVVRRRRRRRRPSSSSSSSSVPIEFPRRYIEYVITYVQRAAAY
jgi:hypothetical protein